MHVPYDRLQTYLRELAAHDLVTPEDRPRLTPRGRELLSRYEAYADALVAAGIEPDPDAW